MRTRRNSGKGISALKIAETTPVGSGGTLQIGDQWNAITILAHSQTHPLKAVCELTENAIDAGGLNIEIQRFRRNGHTWLQITDDGGGVVLTDDGVPNFDHIATHICDSMKRGLHASARKNVHGEYGIGLLSFWAIGQELRMISRDYHGGFHALFLKRGDKDYTVSPVGPEDGLEGTRVIVGPLLDSTRQVVTGDKIQRFLSAELRERIRSTDAQITIVDRLSRRELVVSPREFDGDRLALPEKITTDDGEVTLELYVNGVGDTGAEVALCKDGTRVLNHIGQLIQFEGPPWNDARLRGAVDYPLLNLAPGTRQGVIPDERLGELVAALESVQEQVRDAIESRDRAESEEASRRIQRQVHKVLRRAIQALPENEYLFFDVPRRGEGSESWKKDERTASRKTTAGSDSRCQVTSADRGTVLVEVTATQGGGRRTDEVAVWFVETSSAGASNRKKGLPSYRLQPESDSDQRSHYDIYRNEIVIDSAHSDFVNSNSSSARQRRYVARLYAKEVVLLNFPDASPAKLAERLIELILHTEDNL